MWLHSAQILNKIINKNRDSALDYSLFCWICSCQILPGENVVQIAFLKEPNYCHMVQDQPRSPFQLLTWHLAWEAQILHRIQEECLFLFLWIGGNVKLGIKKSLLRTEREMNKNVHSGIQKSGIQKKNHHVFLPLCIAFFLFHNKSITCKWNGWMDYHVYTNVALACELINALLLQNKTLSCWKEHPPLIFLYPRTTSDHIISFSCL